MSTINYKIGGKEYSFDSFLQLKGVSLIAVEQNLIEEIKTDMHKRKIPQYGFMREITVSLAVLFKITTLTDNDNRGDNEEGNQRDISAYCL